MPEEKENLGDYMKIKHLETRLSEVVKENETLIDELQAKKFEAYKFKNLNESRKELFELIEVTLEDKISNFLNKIGGNKKSITAIQSLISETMSEFKTKVTTEFESELDSYNNSNKSENYKPLINNDQINKYSWNSSESRDASSNQRCSDTVYNGRLIGTQIKIVPKQNRNSSNLTMKSITNKSNNQNLDKNNMHKVSGSLKHLSSLKKPKRGKYLNYMDSSKNNKHTPCKYNKYWNNGTIRWKVS